MKIKTLLLFVISFPKTLWFNFKYFPFYDAIKLPVFVSQRVWLMTMDGNVHLGVVRTGIVRIGYGEVGIFDRRQSRTIWQVTGTVKFKGSARIGHGSKISVVGDLVVGNNFCISAESAIVAYKKVIIGDDVLLSWDVLIMDTDFHHIYSEEISSINPPKAVRIGNKVWVGCRSVILKGVEISEGAVVAANTTLTKSINSQNAIVGGNPARILKEKIQWKL